MDVVVYQSNEVVFFRDPSEDADVLKMVNDQTGQWTEMMNKHRKEQWEMMKTHLSGQDDVFKKQFEVVQARQMKELEAFFAK